MSREFNADWRYKWAMAEDWIVSQATDTYVSSAYLIEKTEQVCPEVFYQFIRAAYWSAVDKGRLERGLKGVRRGPTEKNSTRERR